ncbi:hypothetical protein [Streptomyces mirabilis]|uniref:oxidoreductase n=1 Tax=Streptomyces mirabilis TaxID=68239 RepID=UPI0022530F9F|nr:hypothetical protein [Streptomyces mirabilis]MCX4419403.1 hypothetical protein [Streptomyces mirabilis]
MSIGFDPEFAQVFAPMAEAMAHATPPAVGDVPARRAMWEPIIGAASAAQPIPTDVTTAEHHATADDGTQITMRWYAKTGAAAGPAVLFFHGGGWRHRVRRRGDPRRQRLLRPPFLSSNANERTGRYGGSAVHRIRFATEATSAVAAAIGADRTGLRISPPQLLQRHHRARHARRRYPALLDAIDPLGLAYLHLIHGPDEGFLQHIRRQWSTALIVDRGGTLSTPASPTSTPVWPTPSRRRHCTGQPRPAPPRPHGRPAQRA